MPGWSQDKVGEMRDCYTQVLMYMCHAQPKDKSSHNTVLHPIIKNEFCLLFVCMMGVGMGNDHPPLPPQRHGW